MNLVLSGWNGAGTTTLALILAKNLNYKLMQGTQTFRYLGSKLNYGEHGADRIEVDHFLEQYWGKVYDNYIDTILTTRDHLIIESDIAAVRIGKNEKFHSVFIIADSDVRASRLDMDKRDGDASLLEERDRKLQRHYIDLWGFDWLDLKQITEKYNLIIDNSLKSIVEELKIIYVDLFQRKVITNTQMTNFIETAESNEKLFWQNGKKWYLDYLKDNNLYFDITDIINEIKQNYPSEIAAFPPKLKSALASI